MDEHEHADLFPQPSSWFSSEITYTGSGRIEFSSPQGWIAGLMVCEVNSLGEMSITLDIETSHNNEASSDPDSRDNRDWLISGWKREPASDDMGSRRMYTIPQYVYNTVTSINLETAEGHRFTSDRILDYSWQPTRDVVGVRATMATYIAQPKANAKYWVLPCINLNLDSTFGSTNANAIPDLRTHPLRIFPISQATIDFLDSNAPENERFMVGFQVQAVSTVTFFTYKNQAAFIERLPNADDLISKLKSREVRSGVTSLMIGSYPSEAEEQHPLDLIPVLSLATGRSVGASWIEFRDDTGALVYRIHANFGRYPYRRGRPIIHELYNRGGLGNLLTAASASAEISKPLFRGSLRSCARAISGEDATEMLYFMFTAIDTLCSHYKITEKIRPVEKYLTPTQISAIESELNKAAKAIKAMMSTLTPTSQGTVNEQKTAIDTIVQKTKGGLLEKRKHYADKLLALMTERKLEDAQVLAQYFGDVEKWLDKVNKYRNRTMHWTHYEDVHLPQTRKDFEQLTPHLMDILIRSLLKTIGYTGNYGPYMEAAGGSKDVDWVKASISPRELGYK